MKLFLVCLRHRLLPGERKVHVDQVVVMATNLVSALELGKSSTSFPTKATGEEVYNQPWVHKGHYLDYPTQEEKDRRVALKKDLKRAKGRARRGSWPNFVVVDF